MPRLTRVPTVTSSLGRGTGSGLISSWSARLKMATFAPVPKAIETMAIAVKPGCFAKTRAAWRTSPQRPGSHARADGRERVETPANAKDSDRG